MADADDPRLFVVDLKRGSHPDFNPFAAELFHGDLVDDHSVRKPQVLDLSGQHLHRAAGQRASVQPCQLHVLKRSV